MKRLLLLTFLRLLLGSWQSFEVVQCENVSPHTNESIISLAENGDVTGKGDIQALADEGTDRTHEGTTLRQNLLAGSTVPSREKSEQHNLELELITDTSDDASDDASDDDDHSCVQTCVQSAQEHLLESCLNTSLLLQHSVLCGHQATPEVPRPRLPEIRKRSIKVKREWDGIADFTPTKAVHQGKFCFCVSAAGCYKAQCTCDNMDKCRYGGNSEMICIDRNAVCPEGSSATTSVSTQNLTPSSPCAKTASTKTTATTTTTSATNTISTSTTISTTTTNDARSALPQEASWSSLTTNQILLILFLLLAVVLIIVGVTCFIRRRKRNGQNEGSPTMATNQAETGYPLYATVDADNRPLDVSPQIVTNIYSDLETTQQPTPSNNNITCVSVQPNNGAVDLSRNVYEEIAFVEEDQQKPSCGANQVTASLSPVYSQPFDPSNSAANAVYAEPFSPDKKSPATATILCHQTTTADQHNVYSLATAIPTADPNPVYAEPIKTAKSPAVEAEKSTNPIRQETTIMNRPSQNEAVITVDATVATESRPMPSNHTIYASVQPTSEAVDMGKNIVYADLDLSKKEQQKTSSVNEATHPVSSQPFDPPSSATNMVHTEPFNISQSSVVTAPVLSHTAPTVDQQNVYSLAAAIPTVDPNPVCSEPNEKVKPPTAEERKAVDPVYQKEVEEKAEAESGDVAKQDPSVVNMYTESIKL